MKKVPGWVGALLVSLVVWLWDDNRILSSIPRETITGWHHRHPYMTLLLWTNLWSHMVRGRPRKVLWVV